jgi:hypothetical protein
MSVVERRGAEPFTREGAPAEQVGRDPVSTDAFGAPQRGMARRGRGRLEALGGAVSKHFAGPKLEDAMNSIELAEGERKLFYCWLDERGGDKKGVVVATDRRLILTQAPGIDVLKDRGLASRIPGKMTNSIDYTQIAAVKGRYLGPLSSLVRVLVLILTFQDAEGPPAPVPRVLIDTGESESVQIAVDTENARTLLSLLASRTALDVPSFWMDRLPWAPLKRG